MKEIIDVELKTRTVDLSKCKTDLLAVGLFSDAKGLDKFNSQLNSKLDGAIEQLIELGDFKSKEGTSSIVYGNDSIGAKRIMLVKKMVFTFIKHQPVRIVVPASLGREVELGPQPLPVQVRIIQTPVALGDGLEDGFENAYRELDWLRLARFGRNGACLDSNRLAPIAAHE